MDEANSPKVAGVNRQSSDDRRPQPYPGGCGEGATDRSRGRSSHGVSPVQDPERAVACASGALAAGGTEELMVNFSLASEKNSNSVNQVARLQGGRNRGLSARTR